MKTKPVEWIIVLSICAVLLAVFATADLSISLALYNPRSGFGRFFEIVGELPSPICGILCGAALMVYGTGATKGRRMGKAVFGGFVWVFGALLFAFLLLGNLNVLSAGAASGVAAAAAALGILAVRAIRRHLGERADARSERVALAGALLFVTVLIAFNLLKITWGRARFETMVPMASYALFSPWYLPQGFVLNDAFMSFPSGHAAQSSIILMITLLPLVFARLKGKGALLTVIAYAWIVPVCISRIVIGAHFASDVVAGFLTTYLLFQLWKGALLFPRHKNGGEAA